MIRVTDVAKQERDKYAEIWSTIPEYGAREASPGLLNVNRFMSVMQPPRDGTYTLLDIGCGTGLAGLELQRRGLNVGYLDITEAGLDPQVDRAWFIEAPLWGDWPLRNRHGWDYGFCCDVMEHIPTEFTMLCIERMIAGCRQVWVQLSNRPDNFGRLIGEPLHLTVRPFQWWLVRLNILAAVEEARDLCGESLFVISRRKTNGKSRLS
jgi:hypothetical protein